jgi:MFS family permease
MGLYGLSAASAPALAPIISGFAVETNGWRWAFWEMLWLSGGTLLITIFFLPEVSVFSRHYCEPHWSDLTPTLRPQPTISFFVAPSDSADLRATRIFAPTPRSNRAR